MERNLAFEADPEAFRKDWLTKEQELSEQIARARKLVDKVRYTSRDLLVIADLTAKMQVDGHRADLVILKAARAHAAFEGREAINPRDIALAAELALPHRVKAGPFRQSEMGVTELQEHIEQLKGAASEGKPKDSEQGGGEEDSDQKKSPISPRIELSAEPPGSEPLEPGRQEIFQDATAHWWEGGQKVKPGETFEPRRLDTPLDDMMRKHGGRRSQTQTDRKRGRYIQARPANGNTDDLAFDATLRAAAPFQKAREEMRENVAFAVRREDYQRKVRVRRASNLILFLVDASWSMAVAERMAATKGAILSLLTDAYQRRDRVGLIVFQKDRATLVLPPTNSVLLAQRALADIPVGGKTPLSAGLTMALPGV